MGLNDTPSGERIQIGFFGRRNAGKSSVVNAVTGQDLAVVSDTKGTTTDPVTKSMELLPLGPVVVIDTPGFDDEGALGQLRIKKTKQTLNRVDLAVLIVDATEGFRETEEELIRLFREKEIPYVVAWNKSDLLQTVPSATEKEIWVSALHNTNIYELKEMMARAGKLQESKRVLVRDLMKPEDVILLVMPIDSAAPKGRMILPQQMMIRDVLDGDGIVMGIKEDKVKEALAKLSQKPALVITDSQAFERVAKDVPEDIPLTSFSILMARYKGFLTTAVKGVKAIEELKDGDRVLISEGCTHHRQCGDIGTVKLPAWLKKHTGKELIIETSSGKGFPEDLSPYALVIHCGGCMLNEREVTYRMKSAMDQGVPFTNYGICIAQMKGILKRSVAILEQ
ncbi:MAG: [FeFe] hydrogenase H-cluster maturation GTPase HydF [Lachnospiraceae bacterium]|nr:[FeFe] hydrogenase H-cluster maturation GTPase HydF [Lachnospiraceae bacterium]